MPAFIERLEKYDNLTDSEKKRLRSLLSDYLPTGVDYNFQCEPISENLSESFIELWQKYPENPDPEGEPIESLNQWRRKVADELSLEKIGYLPPEERLERYGSINGKTFKTLLMDVQALSIEEFTGIEFEIPQIFKDMWNVHPENLRPNEDFIITFTEYCKKINDEKRNPEKYVIKSENEKSKNNLVLNELSDEEKEALKMQPPQLFSPTHSFLNTATIDREFIKKKQEEFGQRNDMPTIKDYATVRATNEFPINGYHTAINQDTRIYSEKSFLGPDIKTFKYSQVKNFALNGLTVFGKDWENTNFIIIEPLSDHINNPNLKSLHPGDTFFDVEAEPVPVSKDAIYLIPEDKYKVLMSNPEMQKKLMDKNIKVFRGEAKEAVDMQLCKMGITPCSFRGDIDDNDIRKTQIGNKLMDGLSSISKSIGRPGLEKVMYKAYGGVQQGEYLEKNLEQMNITKARSKKDFFEFFFEQNLSVKGQKEKLIEIAKKDFEDEEEDLGKENVERFEDDIYTRITGEGKQKEIIDQIYDILGEDRINETINQYNQQVQLDFQKRRKRFEEGLPKIETEATNENLRS